MFVVIPESPRWLLKMGKKYQFLKDVKAASKMNKVGAQLGKIS